MPIFEMYETSYRSIRRAKSKKKRRGAFRRYFDGSHTEGAWVCGRLPGRLGLGSQCLLGDRLSESAVESSEIGEHVSRAVALFVASY